MVAPKLCTVKVAHLPAGLNVHVALYRELANSRFLRGQLLEQNRAFEYAFVDGSRVRRANICPVPARADAPGCGQILSTAHALAAVFRAVTDMAGGRMKSHNVHSEIVVALSPNNNVRSGDIRR